MLLDGIKREDRPSFGARIAVPNGAYLVLREAPTSQEEKASGSSHIVLAYEEAGWSSRQWHLGGKVAMVVDGEIVTLHKIRTVITGGKLQITRCQDNACEVIKAKLVN